MATFTEAQTALLTKIATEAATANAEGLSELSTAIQALGGSNGMPDPGPEFVSAITAVLDGVAAQAVNESDPERLGALAYAASVLGSQAMIAEFQATASSSIDTIMTLVQEGTTEITTLRDQTLAYIESVRLDTENLSAFIASSRTQVETLVDEALAHRNAAAGSATAAATSETNAGTSETNSGNSATASANSAAASLADRLLSDQALLDTQAARDEGIAARDASIAAKDGSEAALATLANEVQLAQTARTGAETAETNSAASATASANSEQAGAQHAANADTAKVASEAAQVVTEGARDTTLLAKEATETARDVTLGARDATILARDVTTGARDETVAAKDVTLAARDVTVAAKDEAVAANVVFDQLKADTEAAAAAAATSETNSATSETNAAGSATAADTDRVAAEAARTGSEAARDVTTAARDETVTARDVTLAARDVTTGAKDDVLASQTIVTGAKDDVLAAQILVNADRVAADASATAAGASETNAAADAVATAADRVAAETARTGSETARDASESARDTSVAAKDTSVANLETFQAVHLGLQAADPTVDLNGDPLEGGETYVNSTSKKLRYYNGEQWQDTTAGSNVIVDTFVGNGTTGPYALTVAPASKANCFVIVAGGLQRKDAFEVSGATITFDEALAATDEVEVTIISQLLIGEPSNETVTAAKINAGDIEAILSKLGLDSVDNTSDADKPVSDAQAAAIAAVLAGGYKILHLEYYYDNTTFTTTGDPYSQQGSYRCDHTPKSDTSVLLLISTVYGESTTTGNGGLALVASFYSGTAYDTTGQGGQWRVGHESGTTRVHRNISPLVTLLTQSQRRSDNGKWFSRVAYGPIVSGIEGRIFSTGTIIIELEPIP